MKLRIVITENDVRLLHVDGALPESIAEFVALIKDKCNIQDHTLSIQYMDSDFNAYVNLTDLSVIEDKMTIKINIIMDSPTCQGTGEEGHVDCVETTPEVEAVLRKRGWPEVFEIPKFDADIEQWLINVNDLYKKQNVVSDVSRDKKSRMLYRLCSVAYEYSAYLTQDQTEEIAKALIELHPGIRSKVGHGWECWQNSIAYKMSSFRGELRKLGAKELLYNGKRKSSKNPLGGNPTGLPPAKNIKKPRRGEINYSPNLPTTENDESQEKHRLAMQEEMGSVSLKKSEVARMMSLTYASRREDVNKALAVSTLLEKWPALRLESQVTAEFNRLMNLNLKSAFYSGLDENLDGLQKLLMEPKQGKVALKVKEEFEQQQNPGSQGPLAKETDVQSRRTAVLRCIPTFLQEEDTVLYRHYMNEDDITAEDLNPHVAVQGQGETARYSIVIEKTVVMQHIKNFTDAVCFFFGFIYILHLKYNSKYTYELIQKIIMKIDNKKLTPKMMNIMSKL